LHFNARARDEPKNDENRDFILYFARYFLDSKNTHWKVFHREGRFLNREIGTALKARKLYPETALFFSIGCSLLFLSPAKVHLTLLSPIDNAYLWRRSSVVAALLASYGIIFLLLAIASYKASLNGAFLTERVLRRLGNAIAMLRADLLPAMRRCLFARQNTSCLFLVLGIGIAVRAYFLGQPMRYDEAYTFLNYVNGDFTRAFYYPIPNNHVLHTVLAKLSILFWGAHPESIRLPAFLAGIASIPLMFCLCRELLQGRSGLFASASIAVFPYLILYSTNARGYSIIVFLSLALMLVGVRFSKKPSVEASAILSSVAALGLMTIPSMAFPIAGIYLWLFCAYLLNGNSLDRVLREFVFPSAIMTAAFGAILYSPVVLVTNGLQSLVSNEFVQAQPSEVFLSDIYAHLAEAVADYIRDIPKALLLFCSILVVLGMYSAASRRNWAIFLILPSILAASAVLFIVKHAIPYPRTWIYMIPTVLIVADAGWTYCIEKLSKPFRIVAVNLMLLAGAFYAVFLISTNAIAKYPDTGTFSEAPVVASYLESVMNDGDAVDGIVPVDYPTFFYLWYQDMGDIRPRRDRPTQDKFYIVKKSTYSIEETTEDRVVKLFEMDDAAIYKSIPEESGKKP
jgi:hypothetical protein